jgi:CubicO group peptidase (beta-lactamase class C family)
MNMNVSRNRCLLVICLALGVMFASAEADTDQATEQRIDAAVERAMTLFQVPGMTVAVVNKGEVVYSKGHGVREIGNEDAVDRDTLFQIASVSKAFTAASLALLVDEGKLNWEDRVIDYLPDFRMYDPWVTREFTIRDLLTHRSGLPLGAGDLLFWPAANTNTDEIIRALRYLKPTTSFRSRFDYDNLLYIIAGEVVGRVSGMPYADFVESRLFAPLGMNDCRANSSHSRGIENRATPHIPVDGELQITVTSESDLIAAAGGIQCSAASMTHWLRMWLSHSQQPQDQESEDKPLISPEQVEELLGPVTLLPTNDIMKDNAGSHMTAYALGWSVSSFYGRPIYSHGGGLWGMTTFTAMLPGENLAVFVSNNQMTAAPHAVVYSILDHFLGGDRDWIKIYHDEFTSGQQEASQEVAEAEEARQADSQPNLPLEAYAGTYRDPWYGDIYIEQVEGGLHFRSARSPQLSGPLEHFQFDTFIARWTDRQLMADAYVSFYLTPEGLIERIAMKAVSPATDFSYDFHHLDLRYVKDQK